MATCIDSILTTVAADSRSKCKIKEYPRTTHQTVLQSRSQAAELAVYLSVGDKSQISAPHSRRRPVMTVILKAEIRRDQMNQPLILEFSVSCDLEKTKVIFSWQTILFSQNKKIINLWSSDNLAFCAKTYISTPLSTMSSQNLEN